MRACECVVRVYVVDRFLQFDYYILHYNLLEKAFLITVQITYVIMYIALSSSAESHVPCMDNGYFYPRTNIIHIFTISSRKTDITSLCFNICKYATKLLSDELPCFIIAFHYLPRGQFARLRSHHKLPVIHTQQGHAPYRDESQCDASGLIDCNTCH